MFRTNFSNNISYLYVLSSVKMFWCHNKNVDFFLNQCSDRYLFFYIQNKLSKKNSSKINKAKINSSKINKAKSSSSKINKAKINSSKIQTLNQGWIQNAL